MPAARRGGPPFTRIFFHSNVDPKTGLVLSRPDWAGDAGMKRTRRTAEQIIRMLKPKASAKQWTTEELIVHCKIIDTAPNAIRAPLEAQAVT